MRPVRASVLERLREYDVIGQREFLDRYSSGRPPRAHYLQYGERLYPLKAVWAAAHRPPVHTRDITALEARRGLEELGFDEFIELPSVSRKSK
jgi:hypothetical protein